MSPTSPPFALGTFSAGPTAFAGLVRDGRVADLTDSGGALGLPAGPVTVRLILDHWDEVAPRLATLADAATHWQPVADLDVRAPFEPRQIYQSGANYRTHVIDLHLAHPEAWKVATRDEARVEAEQMMDERIAHGTPYLFIGLHSAIAGPHDDLVLPGYSNQHDWELELAAVIGRPGFRIRREDALDHVAGYTIANDITTRDLVFRRDLAAIGTDWFRAKNAVGFTPLGPYIVPAPFVTDPMDLRITLTLNGQVMQDESTADMIFDVARLIEAVSAIAPIAPGDLLLTGSPAGNGITFGRCLRDGDVMEGTITGLGTQRTRAVAEVTR